MKKSEKIENLIRNIVGNNSYRSSIVGISVKKKSLSTVKQFVKAPTKINRESAILKVKQMLEIKSIKAKSDFNLLQLLMEESDIEKFKQSIETYQLVLNNQDSKGDTLLHMACKMEAITAVKTLIRENVEVNIKNVTF